ncbi:MAG: hypothetical protein AAF429_07210 [Pseudomonadota bacterium]
MIKYALTLTGLLGLLATPLAAEEAVACTDDGLNQVLEQVETAPEDRKDAAMVEYQMAKEKMAEGDAEACSVHLTNASKVATDS